MEFDRALLFFSRYGHAQIVYFSNISSWSLWLCFQLTWKMFLDWDNWGRCKLDTEWVAVCRFLKDFAQLRKSYGMNSLTEPFQLNSCRTRRNCGITQSCNPWGLKSSSLSLLLCRAQRGGMWMRYYELYLPQSSDNVEFLHLDRNRSMPLHRHGDRHLANAVKKDRRGGLKLAWERLASFLSLLISLSSTNDILQSKHRSNRMLSRVRSHVPALLPRIGRLMSLQRTNWGTNGLRNVAT